MKLRVTTGPRSTVLCLRGRITSAPCAGARLSGLLICTHGGLECQEPGRKERARQFWSFKGTRRDSWLRLEKNLETFLREVAIMGEHVCDVPFSHRHHGDAVRQAIALVASSLIQIKTSQK